MGRTACVAAFLTCHSFAILAATEPNATPADDRLSRPEYVVYASEKDSALASSLYRVIGGKRDAKRTVPAFEKADTIEKALQSRAEVLILISTERGAPKIEDGTLEALKQRKIVGIGEGASKLFQKMGLEIHSDACIVFNKQVPEIYLTKSELLGEPKSKATIRVARPDSDIDPEKSDSVFAMFIGPKDDIAADLDVLARCVQHDYYSPVIRQGNCVMVGVPLPSREWTREFADFIESVCRSLRDRKLQPFSVVHHRLTKPGVYEFKLAKRENFPESFHKSFYLQFAKPTRISAKLTHAGSEEVMLLFMSEDEIHRLWTRKDAKNGEPLEISLSIGENDIQEVPDRCWRLNVTNFGKNPVDCKLTIVCETE